MSNQKKSRFLSPIVNIGSRVRDSIGLLRSRFPLPSNAAQTLAKPSASSSSSRVPTPLPSTLSSPPGNNAIIPSASLTASLTHTGTSKHVQPSSYPAKEYTKTALKGAYEFLKVIKESSDVFIPLKSVVGGIIACVEAYKRTSGNRDEMERVLNIIDQLASLLAVKLKESEDHKQLEPMIKRLSESMDKEVTKIEAMHEGGFLIRLAENSDDAKELVSSYRTIKDALDMFYVELGLLVERSTRDILKHVVFQSLPRSRDAYFDASINVENVSRRPCTKDTRVDIVMQIMEWAKETNPAKAPSVYWLNGLGGLGKTTIAYTVCQQLEEAGIPFSSFFCSRQLDSRHSKLLVTTLCRDLSELFSSYASEVLPALETNSKIVDASLNRQIDQLLAKPWQASLTRRDHLPVPVVVVDALDENDRGTEFLQELLHFVQSGNLTGIKFFVTSRPERTLIDLCESFPTNAVCKLHEVDISDVQQDIEKYLCEVLPDLKHEPEIVKLADRAGGFFIYAATAVRYLAPPRPFPPLAPSKKLLQLQNMLSSWPTTAGSFGRLALDELYENVLGIAFWDDRVRREHLQILHTLLCAEGRIEISVIADLSNTDQETVKTVVDSLHAVLFVSSKDACVYWYHTSFPDFIFNRVRAKFWISPQPNYPRQEIDVFCDQSAHHVFLARQCFSVMLRLLQFNICKLNSSCVFDNEVPDLHYRMDRYITLTLRYASRRWARHLSQTTPSENDLNDLALCLNEFMCEKFLFWIEAMNLIDAKFECALLLKDTADWLKLGMQHPGLLAYLTDAALFSTFFAGSQAAKSTPHLYISALAAWYQHSPVWTHWKPRFTYIPSISLPMGTIMVPLLTITTKHWISSVALSVNGNQIVSGSWNSSVQIWDAQTGELLRELQGHTDAVYSVAISPDGNHIASGSEDCSVRLWRANTGEQLRELRDYTSTGPVYSVAFSPDGSRIGSGSADRSVRIWDVETGLPLKMLRGHIDAVTSLVFSPNDKHIVSGSFDQSVRVWNVKSGKQLRVLQGHTSWVNSVALSPDGEYIASGSSDLSVRIWDLKTGEELRTLRGHTDSVKSVSFSPDGGYLVSGSWDQSVIVWDVKTGTQRSELQGHIRTVSSVVFSPDGNQIVSGSWDLSVRVWDVMTSEQLKKPRGHTGSTKSVVFSPDGNQIVSGSWDQSLRMWDATTGEQLKEFQGHTDTVKSVAISPNGDHIVSGSEDQSVRLWDPKTSKELRELRGHNGTVTSVAFSPDGTRVVSGSADRSVVLWDSNAGELLMELHGHISAVNSVAFSPNGSQVASGSTDLSIRVWDVKSGKQLRELNGHTNTVNSVAFSPNGDHIVSGSEDQSVRLWNFKTGEQLRVLRGHTGSVCSVTYSPDGTRIASGSGDQSVRLWDAKTGEQLRELRGHVSMVTSVAFSPNGNRVTSSSTDLSVRVWDVSTGKPVQDHADNARSVLFSPDGGQTTSSSSNQQSYEHVDNILWVLDGDGWIVSTGKRLIWIPPTIRNALHHPYTILIISRRGHATISFENSALGPFWHGCYTPQQLVSHSM